MLAPVGKVKEEARQIPDPRWHARAHVDDLRGGSFRTFDAEEDEGAHGVLDEDEIAHLFAGSPDPERTLPREDTARQVKDGQLALPRAEDMKDTGDPQFTPLAQPLD